MIFSNAEYSQNGVDFDLWHLSRYMSSIHKWGMTFTLWASEWELKMIPIYLVEHKIISPTLLTTDSLTNPDRDCDESLLAIIIYPNGFKKKLRFS